MKKYNKIIILSLSLFMMMPLSFSNNENALLCSTTDLFNEKNHIEKILLKQAKTDEEVKYSEMFVQKGYDNTYYYLRFATAVKGNIETLEYKMSINGEAYAAGDKNADILYKSILASGIKQYYDETNGLTTTPSDYLWTCFTIKFSSEKHRNDNIGVKLTINNKNVVSKSTSLIDELPNFKEQIEAEDCVYYLNDDNTETENKFDHWSVNNSSGAEYYDDTGNLTSASILSGASGKFVGGLNLDGNGKKNNNVYFKFKVNVPEDGEYSLRMRGQSSTQWPPVDTFAININSEKDSDNNLKFTNAEATLPLGYRLGKYADLKGKKYYSWNNLFWWGINDLGNYNLKKGENEIRFYLPNGISGNIDYFEVVQGKENQDNKPKIISMRTGNIVDLSNNDLHLEKGKKLTDIVNTPALHPVKYTLIYLRTSTGKDVAILESMLEGKIDYEKVGLQKITVVDPISNEEASFNLIIEE